MWRESQGPGTSGLEDVLLFGNWKAGGGEAQSLSRMFSCLPVLHRKFQPLHRFEEYLGDQGSRSLIDLPKAKPNKYQS